MQTAVDGKADAGTEITGGAFSDGMLTLEKADGSSIGVDIPLPESYPTINVTEYDSATEINISGSESVSSMENDSFVCFEMIDTQINSNGVGAGAYYNSLVKNISSTTISVNFARRRNSQYAFNQKTINLVPVPFVGFYLEDGNYKMPVEVLKINLGTDTYMYRKIGVGLTDDEYIEFRIENNAFTYTKPPIIKAQNYMTNSKFTATIESIVILYDRIIKVN